VSSCFVKYWKQSVNIQPSCAQGAWTDSGPYCLYFDLYFHQYYDLYSVFCLVFSPVLWHVFCLSFVWYFHQYYGMCSASLLSVPILAHFPALFWHIFFLPVLWPAFRFILSDQPERRSKQGLVTFVLQNSLLLLRICTYLGLCFVSATLN
jgi:hypothetical protein